MTTISRGWFVDEALAAGIDATAAEALFERVRTAQDEDAPAQMSRDEFVEQAQAVGIGATEAGVLYERLQAQNLQRRLPLR